MTSRSYDERYEQLGTEADLVMFVSDKAVETIRSAVWLKRNKNRKNRHWESAINFRDETIPMISLSPGITTHWFVFFSEAQSGAASWFRLATGAEIKYKKGQQEDEV